MCYLAMKNFYHLSILLFYLFISQQSYSQTDLAPGDVAIVGFNTSTWGTGTDCPNNQDNFAFVLLVDVEAGTEIYFTDNGVKADGCLRTNEGTIKWTAPAGGLLKGSIISVYTKDDATCQPAIISGSGTVVDAGIGASFFDLNVSGEQIIVFQGITGSCPDEYIFAASNNETWDGTSSDSHTSALPPGLVDGSTALILPKNGGDFQNNGRFDCSKAASGTKEDILAAIVEAANWEGSENVTYEMPNCSFVFDGLELSYITYDQMRLTWPDPTPTSDELVILAKANSAITAIPSGNGLSYTANTTFGSGTNIGDNTFVIYKGDGSDTELILSGLTEGTTYYFKTYTHLSPDGIFWVEGSTSTPEFDTAQVQPVTLPSVSIGANSNGSVEFEWINYEGTPQSDWWNGGTIIVKKAGSQVTTTQADLNGMNKSINDFSVDDDLGSGNYVAGKLTTGTPGATSNQTISNLECPSGDLYFKIFHHDGASTDKKWSKGLNVGPVTLTSPEIKVLGNNNEIVNNDLSPGINDNTDLGILPTGSSITKTFTIRNIGNGDLTISNTQLTNETPTGQFTISAFPGSPVAKNSAETTFQVTFTPTAVGAKTARIEITTDDCDEATYIFAITGECVNSITFKPTCGPEQTIIMIYGSGFTDIGTHGGDYIQVNGTTIPPSEYTVISDTEIEARIQATTTTGIIEINNNGTIQQSVINFTITEDCQFACP